MVKTVKCEVYYSLSKHMAWCSYSWAIFGQIEILFSVMPLRHFCIIEAFNLQLFQLLNHSDFFFFDPFAAQPLN